MGSKILQEIREITLSTENIIELDNCYKGLFWDLETKQFLRWNEFNNKED
jgi:hypothetical protein|tara:strand:- start:1936 stop:2085 length:150 start_codon:yes stop_codon:yes gene_type:complete